MSNTEPKLKTLEHRLLDLPREELLALVVTVLSRTTPFGAGDSEDARWYLGIAWPPKGHESPSQETVWDRAVMAIPDSTAYETDRSGLVVGPSHGPCEEGRCGGCAAPGVSDLRLGACPLCGGGVKLT